MIYLLLGLVVFLGLHSVRIVAEDWRSAQIKQRGENGYKGLYSLVSVVGLALIVWGYGQARLSPVDLYQPPVVLRHLASVLMLVSFVLLVCAYVPGTRIKGMVHHPMVLSVKVWAFAHLLSNGRMADVLLFGAFLIWAVLDFRAARGRDRKLGTRYAPGAWSRDLLALVIAISVWWLFARFAHAWLIGVAPL